MVYNCKRDNQIKNNEYLLKICAIGSGNTGKTLFIRKFAENKFDTNYLPTLGVDITTKKINVGNNQVKLILVDTAGQEFFGKLRPSYYRGASAGLIFCNINDRKSIEAIPNWLTEFEKHLSYRTHVPMGIVVIKGWKYSPRRRKKKEIKQSLTIRDRILNQCRVIFRRKSQHVLSTIKVSKRRRRNAEINSVSHLTNIQLVRYLADLNQMNLFCIRVDDCKAIEECFVSMARQVITR
ncbi:hypothetical protein CEE45_05880 [Candidatus Heimdallarchaeota archaeon B3_Heim]|nr:MAG: hypothetical protein CEE45_05880 [Candidatus Heimdallarchaeota archaeon B3_Heim]